MHQNYGVFNKILENKLQNEMPGHQDIQSDKQDPGNLLALVV